MQNETQTEFDPKLSHTSTKMSEPQNTTGQSDIDLKSEAKDFFQNAFREYKLGLKNGIQILKSPTKAMNDDSLLNLKNMMLTYFSFVFTLSLLLDIIHQSVYSFGLGSTFHFLGLDILISVGLAGYFFWKEKQESLDFYKLGRVLTISSVLGSAYLIFYSVAASAISSYLFQTYSNDIMSFASLLSKVISVFGLVPYAIKAFFVYLYMFRQAKFTKSAAQIVAVAILVLSSLKFYSYLF